MKKLFICLILMPLIILCGCENTDQNINSNFSISLPTNFTEETANGYKESSSASSSNASSRNPENSSSKNSTSKEEISRDSPSLSNQYFGSKNSTVYHIPNCSSAKKIKEENLIIFEDISEAERRGYRPCARCLKD